MSRKASSLGPTGALLLGLTLAAPAIVAAQSEAEPFSEIVDVRVVNVEVVVTDRDGRPVTGLERDDFHLYVGGEPLELTNFYAAGGTASSGLPSRASGPSPSAAVPPADATASLHAVILVDNSSIRPENRKALFERLREVLLEPVDGQSRFMIATLARGLAIEVPFTGNRERLLAALDEIERQASLHAALDGQRRMFLSRLGHASLRRYQPPPGQQGDPDFDDAIRVALDHSVTVRTLAEERFQAVRATYRNLARLCEALSGLPGRKALLYLSDGLPMRPADSLLESWTAKYQNWAAHNEDDMRLRSRYPRAPDEFRRLMSSLGSSEFDLRNELEDLVVGASASRVVFYPVSAASREAARSSAEVSGSSMHGDVGPGAMRAAATTENFTRDATLLAMADDTGGAALLGGADLAAFMARLRSDFVHYYSLGFAAPEESDDGRFRDLKVEVEGGPFVVRHSRGFAAKTWRQELGERTAAAAVFGHESNPLDVRVDPGEESRDGDSFVVPFMIKIPFEQIQLVHRNGNFNAQVTLLVLVSDTEGGLSETHRVDLPIKIPDSRVLEAMNQLAAYPVELRMKRGRKRVAVGVRDHISGSESAVHLEIDVGRGVQVGG